MENKGSVVQAPCLCIRGTEKSENREKEYARYGLRHVSAVTLELSKLKNKKL